MNTDNIPLYVWHGLKDLNYYEECRREIVQLYGEDKLILVAKCLAATSMNNFMKSNVTIALRALDQIENNKPFHKVGVKNAKAYLQLAVEGKEFPGRKTNSFWKNIAGVDEQCVVVDFWMLEAFGFKNNSPTRKQYDKIEHFIQREAKKRGILPCQLQAVIWTGIRTLKNGVDETNFSTVLSKKVGYLFKHIN